MADTATREQAHELIERIEPNKVPVVIGILEKMLPRESLAQANAPFEDERISAEEENVARHARARGYSAPSSSHEDFLKELGLTPEEFTLMGRDTVDAAKLSR